MALVQRGKRQETQTGVFSHYDFWTDPILFNQEGDTHVSTAGGLPAGEDAGRGEEDDGYWVGGTQQPVAVEGHRDLLSQLLSQRHSRGRGQLPAIGKS